MTRRSRIVRQTGETAIEIELALDGGVETTIEVPDGFFAHMLDALTRHSGIRASIRAQGDTEVDLHHTVEDVGIALGDALDEALGERRGVVRFAHAYAPLDEALARAVVDLSGRGFFAYRAAPEIRNTWVTVDFPLTLIEDFFQSLADRGRLTLHLDILEARNPHHAAEAAFKAVALALREAVRVRDADGDVPSTKGDPESMSAATIIDAGVGNLGNLRRALEFLGAETEITDDPEVVRASRCLLLPGVGAFRPPRETLRGGPEDAIRYALGEGAWLLGICVGFQLLFERSAEFGETDGLALLGGEIASLPTDVQLPHIGWNPLHSTNGSPLLRGVPDGSHMYFVHSFAPLGVPADQVLARCTHGRAFPAVCGAGRVFGAQFHPEKSGELGLRLLANFLEMSRC